MKVEYSQTEGRDFVYIETLQELEMYTAFKCWFDLYKELEARGLLNGENVSFKGPNVTVYLKVQVIKAAAMDEVFNTLPTWEEKRHLEQMMYRAGVIPGEAARMANLFLKNLLTREQ